MTTSFAVGTLLNPLPLTDISCCRKLDRN